MTDIAKSRFHNWIVAARLRTLPLAAANIAMGGALAAYFYQFSMLIFILTLLTALSLQILSNLANDYGDYINGADHAHREGPDRMVQSGAISQAQMQRAIYVMSGVCLIMGSVLLLLSDLALLPLIGFFILGLVAIWAAINYTSGPRPYGYRALGDVSVFIFFGLLSVLGSFYLQSKSWEWSVLLPAVSCGLFSMAVLNINNIRDIPSDALSGKKSLAMILGRPAATRYHIALLAVGIISALVFSIMHFQSYWQFLFLVVLPLLIKNVKAVKYSTKAMELDPYLKQMALTTLLFVVTFSIGLLI